MINRLLNSSFIILSCVQEQRDLCISYEEMINRLLNSSFIILSCVQEQRDLYINYEERMNRSLNSSFIILSCVQDRRDLCINYEEMMNTSYTQASSPCFPGQVLLYQRVPVNIWIKKKSSITYAACVNMNNINHYVLYILKSERSNSIILNTVISTM